MLHIRSSSILHWVKAYASCDFSGMDFRDRIRAILADKSLSVREVSLRVGSDSMLSKLLNPEKRGGIKSPTIDKIEDIARALGVRPGWLAFGDEPQISEPVLHEMARCAVEEIQAGMNIEQIRRTVASSLRDQLALYLTAGATLKSPEAHHTRDLAAQSPTPTTGCELEERRNS